MKVTAIKNVTFPDLNWGIDAGETKDIQDLPKEAQDEILKCYAINKVEDGGKPASAKGK